MGMSTYVQAFRDMDGEFKRMIEAKEFCDERKLSYPIEVETYFKRCAGENRTYLEAEFLQVNTNLWVKDWKDDCREGFEIEVKDIPTEVKTIRFVNSW